MRYEVFIGGESIGHAHNVSCDMPNIVAEFEPAEHFSQVRELFEREYNFLRAGRLDERRVVMDEIFTLGVRLVEQGSRQTITGVPGRLEDGKLAYVHIHRGRIWWRIFQRRE